MARVVENARHRSYVAGPRALVLHFGAVSILRHRPVGRSGCSFAWIIGIVAGAFPFIPFVGTFVGPFMAMGMGAGEFPTGLGGVARSAPYSCSRPVAMEGKRAVGPRCGERVA